MNIVSMQGVDKFYGNIQVLKNLDLEVGQGEVLVIIGASGSGKSTLIRCVNGLEVFQSGTIKVDGYVLPNQSERELSGDKYLLDIFVYDINTYIFIFILSS